jgi:hypothetical protein
MQCKAVCVLMMYYILLRSLLSFYKIWFLVIAYKN